MRRNYSLYGKFRNKANDAWLMPRVRAEDIGRKYNKIKDENGEEYMSSLILFKYYLPIKTEKYTRFTYEDGVTNYRVEGRQELQDWVSIHKFEDDRAFAVEYSFEDEDSFGGQSISTKVSLMRYASYVYAIDRQSRISITDRWTGQVVKETAPEAGVKAYDVGRVGKYVHVSWFRGEEKLTSSERMTEDYWHGGGYVDKFQYTASVYTCVYDPLMTKVLYTLPNVAQIIYFGDEYLITLHRLSDTRLEYALFGVKNMTDEQVYSALQNRTLKGRTIDDQYFDGNEVVKVVDMYTLKDGSSMACTTDKTLIYSNEDKGYKDIAGWKGGYDKLSLAVRELTRRLFYKAYLAPDSREMDMNQIKHMVIQQSFDRAMAEKEKMFKMIEADELKQRAYFHGKAEWDILSSDGWNAKQQMEEIDRYIDWCQTHAAVSADGSRDTWINYIELFMDFSNSIAFDYEGQCQGLEDARAYYEKEDDFVRRYTPPVVRDMAAKQEKGSEILVGLLFEPDGGFSDYGEKVIENAVRMCVGEPEPFSEYRAKYWLNEYEMDEG